MISPHRLAIALAVLVAAPAFAQDKGKDKPPELKTHKLTDKLYVIEGGGGNVAVYTWDEGVLLVDDQVAPLTPMLKAAVAKISRKPIRFVLNTHWHGDHTGGNEGLAADGAVILAHENVRKRMSVDSFVELMNRKVPAAPAKALPVVTFTRDVTLHLGGEEIQVIHVPPAHTDGDSLVVFKTAGVLHMGDCMMTVSYPFVDLSNGGRFEGFITAADKGLELAPAKVIPGHGDMTDKDGLKAWRDMLVAIRDGVKKAISEKKTLAQIQAMKLTAKWDDKLGKMFIKPEQVIEFAYKGLTTK